MDINLVPYREGEHGKYFADPAQKVGCMRCYFTAGDDVMSTFFSTALNLQTKENLKEIMTVTSKLTHSKLMKSFDSMCAFCASQPKAQTGDASSGEYTFFLEKDELRCWIRFVLRRGDYNCYIHCYVKKQKTDGL